MSLHRKVGLHAMNTYLMSALLICMFIIAAKTLALSHKREYSDTQTQDLLMRGAKPEQPEAYLCTAYPLSDKKSYIYKFEALANASTVHHMILYGCNSEPFSTDPVWTCTSMCKEGPQNILFAWAKNAPPTVLPKGVGFRIGNETVIKTLVLQVHYAKAFSREEQADNSGLRIYTTHQEQPYVAGIYLMSGMYFSIPPGDPSYPVDVSCDFEMKKSIFPFAYRTHAHSLGKVITGYLYNGSYFEIGKGNPKWPQTFYPVQNMIEVKPGNALAARCTYDSTSMGNSVSIGSKGKDEMCNFYFMFYTDRSVWDPSGTCFGNNRVDLTGEYFPPNVSVPLPPNPALEEEAKGSHHHHGSMGGTETPEHQALNTPADVWTKDILMRGAKPDTPDSYLCTAYPVNEEEAYVYKFEALANASTAHHILVYGCDGDAFSDQPIWHCPAMCKGFKSTILFAWAKNAPPTTLPKDVGLRIGQKTTIKVIVLQVHYARVFAADEKPDNSGIRVYVTHKKQPFVAGIFLLASSSFSIPPGKSLYPVDISCKFDMEESIFPFAYRTHAHGLGRVITGYQYNDSHHQIGKGNPQWPQAFYPVKDKIEVKHGDYLAARCTYDSTSMTHSVSVGSTGNDEMCNFYIMFYTSSRVRNPSGECYGNEFSLLTGDHFPKDVSEPLPPNPELEEEAKGHHHGPHGGTDNTEPADSRTQDLLILAARPDKPEVHLCTAYQAADQEMYIYKFETLVNESAVHHITAYGCDGESYSSQPTWNCEENTCKSGEKFLMYAWTKGSPTNAFPQGVGIRMGQQTQIKTIVVQVHYSRAFGVNESPDHSGIRIYITQKLPFVVGIYKMASTAFQIPPENSNYPVDIICRFTRTSSITLFKYSVHAHSHGKVTTGYHFNGSSHEIGKGNPQLPETLYPVKDQIEVKPGDYLFARCTYDSSSVIRPVSEGQLKTDEKCSFSTMFYTDSSERDVYDECINNNDLELTGVSFPQDAEAQTGIKFKHILEFNSSWPNDEIVFGQIGGVATDKDGNVYIFHRGSRKWNGQSFSNDNDFMFKDSPIPEDVIIVLNSEGHLVRKFGGGQYFMPHGIEVDKDGNIWLTDVAMHQVFKISRGETLPSMVLGQKFKHSSDVSHFCKPTDVAVLASGEFFVSDGYCNSRVLKFSEDGTFIKAWGERSDWFSNLPPVGSFNIPHSITVSEENQLVCVADRENGRIQCFDLDGNFKHVIKHPEFGSRLFAIEQCHGGVLYAVNGPSNTDISIQGFTLNIKTGELLEKWNVPQNLQNPHDVCVHAGSQSIYVGELNPAAVWKLSRSVGAQGESFNVHIPNKQNNVLETEKSSMGAGTANKLTEADYNNKSLEVLRVIESDNSEMIPIIVGCLLVIPVILILIIILLVRAHSLGKLNCFSGKKKILSLQGIMGYSHKGFDPLKTEDSDHDSDQEEYKTPKIIKNKA